MAYIQERIAFPASYHQWNSTECTAKEFFEITSGSCIIKLRNSTGSYFRFISYDKGNKRAMIYECGGISTRYIEDSYITLYQVLILLGYGRRGWGDNSTENLNWEMRLEQSDQSISVVDLLNTRLEDSCDASILMY